MENSGRRKSVGIIVSTSYQVQARFKMFLFFRDIGKNQQIYIYILYIYTHWSEVSTYGIYHISNQHIDRSIPFAIASQIWRPLWTENVSRIPPMLVPHPEVILSAGKILHCNLRSRRNINWIKCAKKRKLFVQLDLVFFQCWSRQSG